MESTVANNQLLRFTTAGSVDDGKSTLIGRLLYDSKSLFEDQISSIESASKRKGLEDIDLAMFTDGLKDEREQGITIDVAYRYFTTPKRKFIIADTPGHIQYTRNMVTGASTANVALILVDARNGIIEQTKRHSFIASLLAIPHIIVCINKMDLVNYSEEIYNQIVANYQSISAEMEKTDIRFIPISALNGDNVVNPSQNMPWFNGNPLLAELETIEIENDINQEEFRLPVQTVIRPQSKEFHDFRGYVGRIASGTIKKGEEILLLPTQKKSTIKNIFVGNKEIDQAFAPMSICVTIADDIDIARGDMMVEIKNLPTESKEIEVMLCWLNENPSRPRAKYTIKHATTEMKGMIAEILYKVDINSFNQIKDDSPLEVNQICRAKIKLASSIYADLYKKNKITGSIILIDENTNETVAAGTIVKSN